MLHHGARHLFSANIGGLANLLNHNKMMMLMVC